MLRRASLAWADSTAEVRQAISLQPGLDLSYPLAHVHQTWAILRSQRPFRYLRLPPLLFSSLARSTHPHMRAVSCPPRLFFILPDRVIPRHQQPRRNSVPLGLPARLLLYLLQKHPPLRQCASLPFPSSRRMARKPQRALGTRRRSSRTRA